MHDDADPVATTASLLELAEQHGSDKLAHGYVPHYERHLRDRRHEALRVLEIGIGGYRNPDAGGASLRMWRDYLPSSRIVGLDVQEKRLDLGPRVTIVRGSQADPAVLDALHDEHGPFDVVIDDGSHVNSHRDATFRHLFPRMAPGGVYVLEDLHTSYLRRFGGSARELSSPDITTGMLKAMVDGLHHAYVPGRAKEPFDELVAGFAAYPKIAFVLRGDNRPTVAWNDQRAIDEELEALRADAG